MKSFLNYLSVFCFPFCSGNSDRISTRPHWRHIGMQDREYLGTIRYEMHINAR